MSFGGCTCGCHTGTVRHAAPCECTRQPLRRRGPLTDQSAPEPPEISNTEPERDRYVRALEGEAGRLRLFAAACDAEQHCESCAMLRTEWRRAGRSALLDALAKVSEIVARHTHAEARYDADWWEVSAVLEGLNEAHPTTAERGAGAHHPEED